MLTIGTTYSKPELAAMIGNGSVESMKRKLTRYNVVFRITGRGEKANFEILDIQNPFKLFCILELKCGANTDFQKLRNLYFYFFNDEEFCAMPDEVKEQRMMEKGVPVSRQTIANYIQKLVNQEWVYKDSHNYIYYFAYKNTQRIATRAEYSTAWKEYWKNKEQGMDSMEAIIYMRATYGGVARKQAVPEPNAIYLNKIAELNNYIQLSFENEIGD